ncbi:hypothetical protein JCM14469_15790 [Desulfatiferula olefinivorans]
MCFKIIHAIALRGGGITLDRAVCRCETFKRELPWTAESAARNGKRIQKGEDHVGGSQQAE